MGHGYSTIETPYALECGVHGQVFLTEAEYLRQLSRPDDRWVCPLCGAVSCWDDSNYERHMAQYEHDWEPDDPDLNEPPY